MLQHPSTTIIKTIFENYPAKPLLVLTTKLPQPSPAQSVQMAEESWPLKDYAVEEVQRLCKATGSLSPADARQAARLCECGKKILDLSASDLVAAAAGRPILNHKTADGTPLRVSYTARLRHSGSQRSFTRSGKHGAEFMMKNQMLRCLHPSGTLNAARLQDPALMEYGKSAAAQFTLCERGWQSLRQMGHAGCSVEHYCWDRAGIEANDRLWRQWHARKEAEWDRLASQAVPRSILRLTEFVVVTACSLHDTQSAFRWGLGPKLRDSELLRDVYISVESLRNSMDLLLRYVAEWVTGRIVFVKVHDPAWRRGRRALWEALGVDPETVQELAETLELVYDADRCQFQVSEDCSARADVIDLLITSLLSVCKFVKFSGGRFLTGGASTRPLLASLLTGVDGLAKFIHDSGASEYYLQGLKRLIGDRRTMVAECAFISRVTDGVLAILTEDPRVAVRYDDLVLQICEDLKWLVDLPLPLWDEVALATGVSGEALRASCIRGGHVSLHFFWRRVLAPAGQLSWRLCRGNQWTNLIALSEGPQPEEPCSAKLWQLMKLGHNKHQLLSVVELLSDINWSTMMVEQQHGTLAQLHRHHPDYVADTLTSRAFVFQLRKLLPHVSAEEKKIAKLQRDLEKVLRKNQTKLLADRDSFLNCLRICALVA